MFSLIFDVKTNLQLNEHMYVLYGNEYNILKLSYLVLGVYMYMYNVCIFACTINNRVIQCHPNYPCGILVVTETVLSELQGALVRREKEVHMVSCS